MFDNLTFNWLDFSTTMLGLLYLYLEYKANVWMWAVGFVMQIGGIFLYYQSGLYADCGMEFYYTGMTVYGFINWKYLHHSKDTERKITHFETKFILPWIGIFLACWSGIYLVLTKFTDSQVPVADSFTTALSIVGVWALARKYLEQWFIWLVIDLVDFFLYFYKGIPFKATLHGLYAIVAIAGYIKWRKMLD